jgi:hypothetical protein
VASADWITLLTHRSYVDDPANGHGGNHNTGCLSCHNCLVTYSTDSAYFTSMPCRKAGTSGMSGGGYSAMTYRTCISGKQPERVSIFLRHVHHPTKKPMKRSNQTPTLSRTNDNNKGEGRRRCRSVPHGYKVGSTIFNT